MKKSTTSQQSSVSKKSFLQPPPIEQFQKDIAEVYLFYVRLMGWLSKPSMAMALVKGAKEGDSDWLHHFDLSAEEFGITFDSITDSTLARKMMALYDYAYFARQDMSHGPMEDETKFTWISALVVDAEQSVVAQELSLWGWDFDAAWTCRKAAELANARVVLEGGEQFFGFRDPKGDPDSGAGGLSIRQVALLAGMEEMSVRSAANPRRPSPLKTTNANGTTCVEIADAKEWLIAKGRYMPVTRTWGNTDINLSTRGFGSVPELINLVEDKFRNISGSEAQQEAIRKLEQVGIRSYSTPIALGLELSEDLFSNQQTTDVIASTLGFDKQLFALRVREVIAKEELARVQRAILSANEQDTEGSLQSN